MKRSTAMAAVAALALAAACDTAPPPAPVALRACLFETQDSLPLYVMQEQQLDRKYGLRLEAVRVVGAAAAIDSLASGALDLCGSTGIVPLLRAAGSGMVPGSIVPIAVNVLADREHPVMALMVSRAVKDWKDLEGAKIATNAHNSLTTAAIVARLKHEGVGGYSFVEIGFANMGLALAGGNVAAAGMAEPHLAQSLARGDGKLLDWIAGGPVLERMEYTTIVASVPYLRRNPQAVKAFLRMQLVAVRWIGEHPGEARRLLAKRLSLNADVASRMRMRGWAADGRSDPALLENTQQVLLQAGLLDRAIDVRKLHDDTLLSEVLKEAK